MSESESSSGNPLYLVTPVVESKPLGLLTGLNVFLKLENLQPPGSFKCRGISNQCKKAKARGCSGIVCASGGNAGLAAAYSAQVLGLPAHIVLPESTPAFVADKLRNYYGADVQIHGRAWDDANKHALKLCEEQGFEYIHPFDNPDVWDGHTTMIKEAHSQLSRRPDLVIVSVGGGGLFCGVAQGMDEVGWKDVPILAMETYGVDCYNKSVKAGKLFTLDATTSVALCLGARTPCERSLRYYQERPVISEVVPDRDAIHACLRFADDHRMLVEPACGAALAALYSNLIPKLQKEGTLGDVTSVLMIVCGGSGVSLELLQKWKTDFNL